MRRTALVAAALGFALAIAAPVCALAEKQPEDPVEKRFKDLERQIRQLRSIVIQARDTGQPVQVRLTTDPDPTIDSLSNRVDDLEQAARTRNDQIDTLAHDLDAARKDAADVHAQLKDEQDRLAALEGRLKALDEKVSAAAAQAAAAAPPPPGEPPSQLGPPPGPGPASTSADDPQAFARAKQLLLEGKYTAAGTAFQRFVDEHGDSVNGPEAHYWLGETLFIRGMYPEASIAYIGAIRGWPKTDWAPDAVVKLARALMAQNRRQDACSALDDLKRRYPSASPPVKAKAAEVRAAACAA